MESNQKDIERLIELSQNEKRVKQKLVYDSVLLFLEGYKRSEVSKILHVNCCFWRDIKEVKFPKSCM